MEDGIHMSKNQLAKKRKKERKKERKKQL